MAVHHHVEPRKHREGEDDKEQRDDGGVHLAYACGQANAGAYPQSGGRGEAAHLVLACDDDGAHANEAHAGDNRGAIAHHIELGARQLFKNVLAHDHRHRRAQAHQHVSLDARAFVLELARHADDGTHEHGKEQPQEHCLRAPASCYLTEMYKVPTKHPAAVPATNATRFPSLYLSRFQRRPDIGSIPP